jgi:hypothetical protein
MPSGCAPSSVCTRGKSDSVVLCMRIDEAPLAERICVFLGARAKMSVG